MTKTQNYLNRLTSTLWFVPTMFVVGGVLLGFLFVGIDYVYDSPFNYLHELFGVQASGARDILSVIAGSTITVAGTVFSITVVALTLASTQFSPRILRNFMRDSGNQAVLGTLVGIFAYCIFVLRTVRGGDANSGDDFVPATAVFFAVMFGFVGIGCLVYFIHHVATSIQATSIISQIMHETVQEIRKRFPEDKETRDIDEETKKLLKKGGKNVNAKVTGYVQNADFDKLREIADEYNVLLKLNRRIGQFSIQNLHFVEVFSENSEFEIDDDFSDKIQNTYDIDDYRTVQGDIAFGLRQIVDIALKALSPSINDTTTAVTCIDYLTSILVSLAKRPDCPSYYFSKDKLRLVVEEQTFEDFFDLSFNQIRQNATGNVAVILRQLNSINILSIENLKFKFADERRERHDLMQIQAKAIFEMAQKTVKADIDLKTVENYFKRVKKSLSERESNI